jgi:hypothetical protein
VSAVALDRARLARVLEMIGSSFDGEALVAARRAHTLVKAAGLSWESVLSAPAETSNRWTEPSTVRDAIDRCIEFDEYLTEWERAFIGSIAGWRRPLSPKQKKRLDELVDKVRRIARARGAAA